MAGALERVVLRYPSRESMSRAAAEGIIEITARALETKDHAAWALSGGSTPRVLYELLGGEFRERIPWERVDLYWGDERYVPKGDPASNFRMVHEAMLRFIDFPKGNLFPMPTNRENPDDAARDYESLVRKQFPGDSPRFDLILLGLGTDGHTASLFPGSAALTERTRWVVPVEAPVEPRLRLTLTLGVLNAGLHVYFLVSGGKKARILRDVLVGPADAAKHPAGAVRPADGEVVWWVDDAAAAELDAP